MELTGRTKEDFESWAEENGLLYSGLPMQFINTVILDFFDFVGIYVHVMPRFYKIIVYNRDISGCDPNIVIESEFYYDNRSLTIDAAIKQCNDIYNQNLFIQIY